MGERRHPTPVDKSQSKPPAPPAPPAKRTLNASQKVIADTLKEVQRLLEGRDDCRIVLLSHVVDGPPENGWRTRRLTDTRYVIFSIGPVEVDVENIIRLVLG